MFGSIHIVSATDCIVEYTQYTKNKNSYPDDIITLFGKDAITRIRLFLTDSTTVDYVNRTDKKNLYKVICEGKVSIFDSDKGMLIVRGDTVEQIGYANKKKLIEKINELFNSNFIESDFKSEAELMNWLKEHAK